MLIILYSRYILADVRRVHSSLSLFYVRIFHSFILVYRFQCSRSFKHRATWSRYSCSLVIDIFDSGFSLFSTHSTFVRLLHATHYIHIISILQSAGAMWTLNNRAELNESSELISDKPVFKPYPPYKNY